MNAADEAAEYVALLRGIAPSNPNMRNERLRSVFEDLGYEDVRTVISSGNVLFRSDTADTAAMEAALEAAWPEKLGFTSTTIIRGIDEIEELVARDPFAGLEHSRESYLLVTFCKHAPEVDFDLPHRTESQASEVLGRSERELFSVTDTTASGTPDLMLWMERKFGKEISSRTWLTVHRILKKSQTA